MIVFFGQCPAGKDHCAEGKDSRDKSGKIAIKLHSGSVIHSNRGITLPAATMAAAYPLKGILLQILPKPTRVTVHQRK